VKTLKWILQVVADVIFSTEFVWIKIMIVVCCCEQDNEIRGLEL